jgi:hypothetical protein
MPLINPCYDLRRMQNFLGRMQLREIGAEF